MSVATLLSVEDNPSQQYVLKQLCESFDYEVHFVTSGEDAIGALASTQYAAVLMDITLPGIDGFECTSRIREQERLTVSRRTPIIAVTARAFDQDRKACYDAGMDDYLCKPFKPDSLRRMLLKWVYQPDKPNMKLLQPSLGRVEQTTELGDVG